MSPRGGFTLVEVIVAVTLLAVGVLGYAAAVGAARASLRRSHAQERAAIAVAALADSLLAASGGGDGARADGDLAVTWSAHDAGNVREVRFSVRVSGVRPWSAQLTAVGGRP